MVTRSHSLGRLHHRRLWAASGLQLRVSTCFREKASSSERRSLHAGALQQACKCCGRELFPLWPLGIRGHIWSYKRAQVFPVGNGCLRGDRLFGQAKATLWHGSGNRGAASTQRSRLLSCREQLSQRPTLGQKWSREAVDSLSSLSLQSANLKAGGSHVEAALVASTAVVIQAEQFHEKYVKASINRPIYRRGE
jgi:hypothetical protein